MNSTTASHPTAPHPAAPHATFDSDRLVRADEKLQRKILATIRKKSFCILATTSPAARSHSAGVIYEYVQGQLWIHSLRNSRKARSIAKNSHVGVTIPFRRLPAGPPFTIHFQATAEIVDMDSPRVLSLLESGRLSAIAGHGALQMTEGCFLVLEPVGSVHSYGLGARVIDLIRDPLNNGFAMFDLDEVER
jgi:hypothetical protein